MYVGSQKAFARQLFEDLLLPSLYYDLLERGSLAKFFADAYECPELESYIQQFEKTTGCLVYYVTACDTAMGYMYNLLYVSSYIEDWPHHLRRCKDGSFIVSAWVWNKTADYCSEFGSIQVTSANGFLERIA